MAIGKAIQEEWDWCRRCGRQYHISKLQKQQGILRCTITCIDDLSNQYRKKIADEMLKGSQEGASDKPELFRNPGEVVFE